MFTESQSVLSQITVKRSLSQKGHGKEGVIVGPHGAPPKGETFTNHPLSPRACGPMTTMVESLPPPPCCVSEPSFAPCALDNAQCRELQTAPRSPHGVNVRGARELETHPALWRGASLACRSGLVPTPWRVASPAFHKERCSSHRVHEEHFDAPSMATFSDGNGVVEKMCVSLLKRS
jgi:hypothetical protein